MKIAIAQLNPMLGDLTGNAERILEYAEHAKSAGATLLVTPELIARAKSRGWHVNVWTVNDLKLGVKLLEMGVNALIGDDPASLLEARKRFLHAKTS